jgi:restriction endonuclease S subunit
VNYFNIPIFASDCSTIQVKDDKKLLSEFVYQILKSIQDDIYNFQRGGGQPHVYPKDLEVIKIPLLPFEIQEQIVEELGGYQNIISGSRQVVENWKPKIDIDPEWEKVKLPFISENYDNKRKPVTKSNRSSGQYPYYGASGIVDYVEDYIFDGDYLLISEDGANLLARSTPIAFSVSGKSWVNNHAHILKFKNDSTQKFVETYINQIDISNFVTGAAQPKLNQQALNTIEIPLPALEIQKQIVDKIETERVLVESAKKLIGIYEQKTKDVLSKLWSE